MPGAPEQAPQTWPDRCPNCQAALTGRFCAACGQDQSHDLRRPLRRFVGEVIEEAVALDSRFGHTIAPLLFRPGRVAADMSAGQRARYSSPVRLYLVASLLFFLGAAFAPEHSPNVQVDLGGAERTRLAITLGEPAARGEPAAAEGSPAAPDGTAEEPAQVNQGLEELRQSGALGAVLAERVDRLRRLPPGEAQRRFQDAFDAHAPAALFVLVPILAM